MLVEEIGAVEVVLRVLLALVPSVLIGLERELSSQPAGLRTHVLLGLGAVLFTLAGVAFMETSPSRIAAQVASGVGFLGAGAIIQERMQVRGLTTAASLWVTAAIGVAAGSGAYLAVGAVTLFALIVLTLLKWIEREFFPRRRGQSLEVYFAPDASLDRGYEDVQRVAGKVELREIQPTPGGGHCLLGHIRIVRTRDVVMVTEELRALPGVIGVGLSR